MLSLTEMAADDEKILNDPQRLGKDSAVYALQDKGPVHGADEKGMVDITGPKGYNPARGAVPAKSCRRLLRIRELCHDSLAVDQMNIPSLGTTIVVGVFNYRKFEDIG